MNRNQTGAAVNPMNKIIIFSVRVVLATLFALLITRIFRPESGPAGTAVMAACFLAAAYGLEYFRNGQDRKGRE